MDAWPVVHRHYMGLSYSPSLLPHATFCHLESSIMPSLPNELYLQIASYLEHAGHISSFMQTTKRVHHLPTPVLYDFAVRRYYAVEILILAAEHGHIRVIQKMLDGGVFGRASAFNGWKIIKLAVMNRHAAVADQLQQNGIEDVTRPSEVEWVYPKCLISGHVGCKILGLILQYADESVLRVLVEHEITKGMTARAGSCRDLSVDEFIKLHLLQAAGKKHPVQDEIPLHSAGSRNQRHSVVCSRMVLTRTSMNTTGNQRYSGQLILEILRCCGSFLSTE